MAFGLRPRRTVGFNQERETPFAEIQGGGAANPDAQQQRYKRARGPKWQTYHVVVIEEAQGCNALIVPINSHHGFRGGCQRVFQVCLPGLILISVGKLLEAHRVIL